LIYTHCQAGIILSEDSYYGWHFEAILTFQSKDEAYLSGVLTAPNYKSTDIVSSKKISSINTLAYFSAASLMKKILLNIDTEVSFSLFRQWSQEKCHQEPK